MDNKGDIKLSTLKQTMYCFDWPKQKKAIQVEYDFLIENEI